MGGPTKFTGSTLFPGPTYRRAHNVAAAPRSCGPTACKLQVLCEIANIVD